MKRQVSVSLEPELVELAKRRGGVSRIAQRALRQYLDAPAEGRLELDVDKRLRRDLYNKAAELGREPAELVNALLRNVKDLTEDEINPELKRARAKQRARELLGG